MAKITDPKMHPYFIGKDTHCYTVYEIVTPQEKYLAKGSKGKDYEKPLGHYGKLSAALKKIVKAKVELKEEYGSILEYIEAYDQQKETINKLFNQLEV